MKVIQAQANQGEESHQPVDLSFAQTCLGLSTMDKLYIPSYGHKPLISTLHTHYILDSFRTRDREMRGQVTMGYEDFVGLAMGAHK